LPTSNPKKVHGKPHVPCQVHSQIVLASTTVLSRIKTVAKQKNRTAEAAAAVVVVVVVVRVTQDNSHSTGI
jgi:hypothetical protein